MASANPRWPEAIVVLVLALFHAQVGAGAEPAVPKSALGRARVASNAVVEARLLVHPDDRDGRDRVRVGVLFDLPVGWHMYWRDPGDTGLPTELHWEVEGAVIGPIAWPTPSRFYEADGELVTNGYSGQVLLAAPAVFRGGSALSQRIGVEADLLVCETECVPLHFSLSRAVTPQTPTFASEAERDRVRGLFAKYAARVPQAAGSGGPGLAVALLLAFVGGLVLNLMPCVLPVLAIKICGLAELAHSSRREMARHGLAYTLGIALSMSLLAFAVILLRAAGTSVGWGFQLQEPLFVALLCALLVAFAMNLFGVFEISVHTGKLAAIGAGARGARRSFFEGLLVVVLATPCSAPFLGSAVGFAFASSSLAVVGIFLAIGAGIAAPFVLASFVPGLSSWIPRSGAWMQKLRTALGFCLLGSAVWLLWVFGRTTGADAMAALLSLLVAAAFATWLFGWAQSIERNRLARGLGFASAALLLVGFNSVGTRVSPQDPGGAALARHWRPFHADFVADALRRGQPALVSFTADWCITCKVNERAVLSSEAVLAELERLDVATFKADWTRRDEEIRAELARLGRAGVPLVVVYAPDAPDRPQQLPDLLSVGSLIEALQQAVVTDVTRL